MIPLHLRRMVYSFLEQVARCTFRTTKRPVHLILPLLNRLGYVKGGRIKGARTPETIRTTIDFIRM